MDLSLIELWSATGPLARGVVVLLGGMSLAATGVAAEKWLRIRRIEGETDELLGTWRKNSTMGEADLTALAEGHSLSPVAALFADQSGIPESDDETRREVHDRTVRRHVLGSGVELRRGLGILATVASTAPFVGLFGTTIGVVNA